MSQGGYFSPSIHSDTLQNMTIRRWSEVFQPQLDSIAQGFIGRGFGTVPKRTVRDGQSNRGLSLAHSDLALEVLACRPVALTFFHLLTSHQPTNGTHHPCWTRFTLLPSFVGHASHTFSCIFCMDCYRFVRSLHVRITLSIQLLHSSGGLS